MNSTDAVATRGYPVRDMPQHGANDVLIADGVKYADAFGSPYYRKKLENSAPFGFIRLTQDEASVAFQTIHRHDTLVQNAPLGVRTFTEDNFAFWSRCAKAQLAELRYHYRLLQRVDVSHENGRTYAAELGRKISDDRAGFRSAMSHRRNKRYLSRPAEQVSSEWKLAVYNFCQFLLVIQGSRCDPNFVGQMVDNIITPAYQEINSAYKFEANSMRERNKLKTVSAFVLERDNDLCAFGYKFDFERCFRRAEVKYAAGRLNIGHILNSMLESFSV